MLVLARAVNEVVRIGDNIRVMVLRDGRDGGKVRLGIDAPVDVPVHREEVYQAIKRSEKYE